MCACPCAAEASSSKAPWAGKRAEDWVVLRQDKHGGKYWREQTHVCVGAVIYDVIHWIYVGDTVLAGGYTLNASIYIYMFV